MATPRAEAEGTTQPSFSNDLADYPAILAKALDALQGDEENGFACAEIIVNNFYHKAQRDLSFYESILRLTVTNRHYKEANATAKNQLKEILFLLDRNFNRGGSQAYWVDVARGEPSAEKRQTPTPTPLLFTIYASW